MQEVTYNATLTLPGLLCKQALQHQLIFDQLHVVGHDNRQDLLPPEGRQDCLLTP
jgi:hypothetical protein